MRLLRATGLILGVLTHGAGGAASATCRLDKGPERTVARILDAETVELDDGMRVRLAGILAPRARDAGVAAGRWPPEIAATAALDALVSATTVRLQFDTTRRDRHGNTLAYLVRADDAEGPSIQERLLAEGHARVDAIDGQRRCIDTLLAAEAVARATGRGVWADAAYRVRAAVPSRDLNAYRGTFQVIAGTIAKVETSRGIVRLILGDDRRRDVTLAIRATDRETVGALGGDFKQLAGRHVEVRGWLGQRPFGGTEIDLSLAGHARLVDGLSLTPNKR